MMSSKSQLWKDNGSLPQPLESWSNICAPAPLPPDVTFVQISVITDSSAQCTSVLPVEKQHPVMQHIIVWRPSVISVIDGNILTMFATFESVEDVMPQDMWLITAQSTHWPSLTFTALMEEPTQTTMTSIPLWMTTKGMVCIEPGA